MTEEIFDLIVIGGGAAGFFGAIRTAELRPGSKILILEKTTKLLSKVRISGGGRCNVTHNEFNPIRLADHYPRGEKPLKSLFKTFHAQHVVEWFAAKEVRMKAEDDGRMFPITDDSQTIINCFLKEALSLKIRIEMEKGVRSIRNHEGGFIVVCRDESSFSCKTILVASGGNVNVQAYDFLSGHDHTIVKPIPSLFTFNDPEGKFHDLMGLSVACAEVRIAKTKLQAKGPVLITHWGLSGPAVIRLSAWAAEYLHQQNYRFTIHVNWTGEIIEDDLKKILSAQKLTKGKQKVFTNPMFSIPQRLWSRLCELAEIPEEKIWSELPQKNINKLMENLIRCPFGIQGKTTFKEEFVTCGGVDLKEVDTATMESKKIKNLFFAGEVLNMDGETGGFNFQAAWTTANAAAVSLSSRI